MWYTGFTERVVQIGAELNSPLYGNADPHHWRAAHPRDYMFLVYVTDLAVEPWEEQAG